MIQLWHPLVNVVLDFILSELFEKSEVSEVKPSPPLYTQRFVILQPNCQPADLMVFKFNCNTFNSILCSVTPDQIDILVSNSSLARCISYDGFFKWWIWFHYVTIWNTWGTTIWYFSHPDLFPLLSDRMFVFCLRLKIMAVFAHCTPPTLYFLLHDRTINVECYLFHKY